MNQRYDNHRDWRGDPRNERERDGERGGPESYGFEEAAPEGQYERDPKFESPRDQYGQGQERREQYRGDWSGPERRSDERLRHDISERLMQAYHIDASEVTVEVSGGKVVLEGTVPSRHMKHAIEDLADAAPGVQDIENRIRVEDPKRKE